MPPGNCFFFCTNPKTPVLTSPWELGPYLRGPLSAIWGGVVQGRQECRSRFVVPRSNELVQTARKSKGARGHGSVIIFFAPRPPGVGGRVLATNPRQRSLSRAPFMARRMGVAVEGVCLLVVLIGRLSRRGTGLVGVLNEVPWSVQCDS